MDSKLKDMLFTTIDNYKLLPYLFREDFFSLKHKELFSLLIEKLRSGDIDRQKYIEYDTSIGQFINRTKKEIVVELNKILKSLNIKGVFHFGDKDLRFTPYKYSVFKGQNVRRRATSLLPLSRHVYYYYIKVEDWLKNGKTRINIDLNTHVSKDNLEYTLIMKTLAGIEEKAPNGIFSLIKKNLGGSDIDFNMKVLNVSYDIHCITLKPLTYQTKRKNFLEVLNKNTFPITIKGEKNKIGVFTIKVLSVDKNEKLSTTIEAENKKICFVDGDLSEVMNRIVDYIPLRMHDLNEMIVK